MANALPGSIKNGDLTSPRRSAAAITPDDNNDMGEYAYGIYVGTAGNVSVHMVNEGELSNVSVTFSNVPAGVILPIVARRVLATGTSASGLVALIP